MTLYLMCSLVASTTSIRAPLYPITLDSLRSYSTSLLKAEQPAIQVLPPLARADEPLSANMSETATPRKFSVEGEQGLEDDERTGTSPRWTGDRGDGEGDPTAVYGGVQTEDRPGGRRVQDAGRGRGVVAARGVVLLASHDVARGAGARGTGRGAEEAGARAAGRRSARQEARRARAGDQPVEEARRTG